MEQNNPSRRRFGSWFAGMTAMFGGAASAQTTLAPVPKDKFVLPMQRAKSFTPNTMMDGYTAEAKNRFMQTMMAASPFSVRDGINFMAVKREIKAGVSYDDAVASMKLAANKVNFKYVGNNPIWKDITAMTGKPTPRVEIFNFCDAMVARELLDYSLEFVIFLPCRIAIVEDAHKKLWIAMQDWDVKWLDSSPNPNRMPVSLYNHAVRLRKSMEEIMVATAEGDI